MYIEAGTLPAFQFEAGTQTATPCDTGGQFKAGKYGGIASAVGEVFTFGGSLGQIFISGVSGQICIVSSGTTPNIQGIMDYAQF
jgi:hypothetical protein